jgi:hypothetical protein
MTTSRRERSPGGDQASAIWWAAASWWRTGVVLTNGDAGEHEVGAEPGFCA